MGFGEKTGGFPYQQQSEKETRLTLDGCLPYVISGEVSPLLLNRLGVPFDHAVKTFNSLVVNRIKVNPPRIISSFDGCLPHVISGQVRPHPAG